MATVTNYPIDLPILVIEAQIFVAVKKFPFLPNKLIPNGYDERKSFWFYFKSQFNNSILIFSNYHLYIYWWNVADMVREKLVPKYISWKNGQNDHRIDLSCTVSGQLLVPSKVDQEYGDWRTKLFMSSSRDNKNYLINSKLSLAKAGK